MDLHCSYSVSRRVDDHLHRSLNIEYDLGYHLVLWNHLQTSID